MEFQVDLISPRQVRAAAVIGAGAILLLVAAGLYVHPIRTLPSARSTAAVGAPSPIRTAGPEGKALMLPYYAQRGYANYARAAPGALRITFIAPDSADGVSQPGFSWTSAGGPVRSSGPDRFAASP